MGSGHFLLSAANRTTDFILELLDQVPASGTGASGDNSPNVWRRQVTRHCLYGVDLNPLAVNLAKLSLWLNSFARDHKLTFLDHRLKVGNSLIGLRSLDALKQRPVRDGERKSKKMREELPGFRKFEQEFEVAARRVAELTEIDEDDTDRQKQEYETARDVMQAVMGPLADLYTAYLMDEGISPDNYRDLFLASSKQEHGVLFRDGACEQAQARVQELCRRHHFFHWPLEFPDVFAGVDSATGFDGTVGNPPWDMSSANPQEFFSEYDRGFRNLNRTESLARMSELCSRNPEIAERWEVFQRTFEQQNAYFKETSAYATPPGGRSNLFQYFLHRSHDLISGYGWLGMVVPSGIYTDKGCLPLRRLFFGHSRIDSLYCFENRWPVVFPAVDGRFKFVTFCTQKGGLTESFKCAFMEHDPERLAAIDAGALRMGVEQVRKFAPDSLSVMEFKSQADIDITAKIYGENPLLGVVLPEAWNVKFSIEFMSNTDAPRFQEITGKGVPVIAGRNFFQYDDGLLPSDREIPVAHLEQLYASGAQKWQEYRLVFRDIAASTNERTCISSLIAPPSACLETARLIYVEDTGSRDAGEQLSVLTALLGVLNSVVIDFLMRQMVTSHLSQHIMSRLPIPRFSRGHRLAGLIVARAARLSCLSEGFATMWGLLCRKEWSSARFWGGQPTAYGPWEEQEIRQRLAESAKELTAEWGPHCGVHDRMPDRRDTGDRAQLRAEIDAYVAHLYGLSHDEFAYILDTFPVLKRKEIAAFGEFKSKRKCLEEYDRLAGVL
jgi:hypothetical protein